MPAKKTMHCRAPGRPRDPDLESRILQVALRLMASQGYERMTLDEVAIEAAVSKPTIYRRWNSKADLATAAVRTLQISEPAIEATTAVQELTGILQNFRRSLLRPYGMALVGTVLAEEAHNPELLKLFRERLVAPRRKSILAVLEHASKRGELLPSANLDVAVTALAGGLYGYYLAHSRINPEFVAELVKIVWNGIAIRKWKTAPPS